MFSRASVALLMLLIASRTADSETRTWTSASGGQSIEAEYVSAEDGKVTLRKSDGSTVAVPIAKLSVADQQYIEKRDVPPPSEDDTESENVMGGESRVRVELLALQIGKPRPTIPEDQQGVPMLMMGSQGTQLNLWLYDAKRSFLGIDEEKSSVKLFDNLGNDLLKQKKNGGGFNMIPGFSMNLQQSPLRVSVAVHRHSCDVSINGPQTPSKAAERVTLDASIVARFGANAEQTEAPAVALEKGTTYELGPVTFEVEDTGNDGFFEEDKLSIVIKTKQDLDIVQKYEFVDGDGQVVEHVERGSMFNQGFGTQINVAFPKEMDQLGMRLTYFKDVESVKVPVKLSTGIGF